MSLQPREHPCPCTWCGYGTWNTTAVCDREQCVNAEARSRRRWSEMRQGTVSPSPLVPHPGVSRPISG